MKKQFILLLLALFTVCHISREVQADDYLRVGMEAAYAPFNWTQDTDENGAVPIEGTTQFANGYDVQVAKNIAEALDKELLVVKTKWEGLVPALTSGKIDMIIAGMSPTQERQKEIAFSTSYYTSIPTLVVRSDSKWATVHSIQDFQGAKVTAQQGVYLYDLIDQMDGVEKQTAMGDFSQIRQALEAGIIDAYVSERPEARTAQEANPAFQMVELTDGFETEAEDVTIAVGMRKDDTRITQVNQVLARFTIEDQLALMDTMIEKQPVDSSSEESQPAFLVQVWTIFTNNWQQLLHGTGMTLLISILGTLIGTCIGLLIGVFRTAPKAENSVFLFLQKALAILINIYIEVFRGTPMIVQAMVIYYGSAQAFGLNLDRTMAAIFIVSINTGAYMSEIVRGGIFAVDKGQFEAATALGFTHRQTMQKIVLPQVIRNILPATGNEFVINIKDTSVLNVISVVELYFSGNTVATQTYQYFQTFTVIAIIYFILTFSVTRILRLIEKRLDTDTYTTGANQMQTEVLHD